MSVLTLRHFTDPACPIDYSAEPARWALRWLYGDAIAWELRMVVLSEDVRESEAKGLTVERLAENYARLGQRHGMPFDTAPRAQLAASIDGCRAVVGARLHRPELEEALLRRLRIRTMGGGALLDDPALLGAAASDVGIDPDELLVWMREPAVEAELRRDMAAARAPAAPARALDHKLSDAGSGRRYSTPSYEVVREADGATLVAPGFQALGTYEVLIANLAPQLERRPAPDSALEVLAWAGEPLAAAEVAAVLGADRQAVRAELDEVAAPDPDGGGEFWSVPATALAA